MDPYCNLTDGMDMAVPVFGPIPLDDITGTEPATPVAAASARPQGQNSGAPTSNGRPIQALIITGDNVGAHKWKETSQALKEMLEKGGRIKVDITATPSKDLTDENLGKYDVLILNYKDTPNGPPESRWSDANKEAFLKAVHDGKGLVAYHFASAAFAKPNWEEFEKAVAGGWRTQGFHGPAHVFTVKKTDAKHPISDGLPAQFEHSDRRALSELDADARERGAGDGLFRPRTSPGARARMSRSSGSTTTARVGSTRTCWATTPRRWPTPISRSGCAGVSSGRPPGRRNELRDARR